VVNRLSPGRQPDDHRQRPGGCQRRDLDRRHPDRTHRSSPATRAVARQHCRSGQSVSTPAASAGRRFSSGASQAWLRHPESCTALSIARQIESGQASSTVHIGLPGFLASPSAAVPVGHDHKRALVSGSKPARRAADAGIRGRRHPSPRWANKTVDFAWHSLPADQEPSSGRQGVDRLDGSSRDCTHGHGHAGDRAPRLISTVTWPSSSIRRPSGPGYQHGLVGALSTPWPARRSAALRSPSMALGPMTAASSTVG